MGINCSSMCMYVHYTTAQLKNDHNLELSLNDFFRKRSFQSKDFLLKKTIKLNSYFEQKKRPKMTFTLISDNTRICSSFQKNEIKLLANMLLLY